MKFFRFRFAAFSMMLVSALGLAACGGGATSSGADGGIIATGRAIVNGNVASSTLPGDLNNITVSIQDRSGLTNANGEFVLSDVAAGSQQLVFSKSGESASLALSIQSQSQTTLSNVHIVQQSVRTEDIEVEDHGPTKEGEEDTLKPEDDEPLDTGLDDDEDNPDRDDQSDEEDEEDKEDEEDQPDEEDDVSEDAGK